MKNKKWMNDGTVNGLGTGVVNVNSLEFTELQRQIIEKSRHLSKQQRIENKLFSIRFQMESYLTSQTADIIEVGWFFKACVQSLGIKHKVFADYIGFKESNLSALYKGKRKINIDLALKLGSIFKINPTLWMHIQSKNELLKVKRENRKAYQKYTINDLL